MGQTEDAGYRPMFEYLSLLGQVNATGGLAGVQIEASPSPNVKRKKKANENRKLNKKAFEGSEGCEDEEEEPKKLYPRSKNSQATTRHNVMTSWVLNTFYIMNFKSSQQAFKPPSESRSFIYPRVREGLGLHYGWMKFAVSRLQLGPMRVLNRN
jgi:hypothetical protein